MENNRNTIDTRFKQAADTKEKENFAQMENIWSRIEQKLDYNKERITTPWYRYAGIAALLLLCLTAGTFIFKNENTAPAQTENEVTTIDYEKIKQAAKPAQRDKLIKEEVVVNDSVRRFFTSGTMKNTSAKKPAVKNRKQTYFAAGKTHKTVNQNSFIPFSKIKSSAVTDSIINRNITVTNEKYNQDILSGLQGYVPGIKVESLVPFTTDTSKRILKSLPGNVPAMSITLGDGPPGNSGNKLKHMPFKEVRKNTLTENITKTPEEQFMADFNNKKLRLYVVGGIATVIKVTEHEFAKQSGFTYHDFGCLAPPHITYYEKYNHLVLDHLKLNLKKGWQKDIAPNTIGLQNWKKKQ